MAIGRSNNVREREKGKKESGYVAQYGCCSSRDKVSIQTLNFKVV